MTGLVFVSSSADLFDLRHRVGGELSRWLREHGFEHLVAPYLWEDDTEGGRLLSDRVQIQPQLPDPATDDVLLTICVFGERCGLPLNDKIPPHWEDRLARWRSTADTPGLLHPWPADLEAQAAALVRGDFPLTGTVFEYFSAHDQAPETDNLVVAYTASCFVEDQTLLEAIDFNDRQLWQRLSSKCGSDSERATLKRHVYEPQKAGLLNLLRFISQKIAAPPWYRTLEEMERNIVARAKDKLRKRLNIVSLRNPFKSTLEHWTVNDRLELPGRGRKVQEICAEIGRHHDGLVLLKGRSGCGKSSLMQRGVLTYLRDHGRLVLPLRPTDLDDFSESRDRLDILWQRIADTVDCHDSSVSNPEVRRGRERRMADHLCDVLARRGAQLVIGLDQFEEILDELNLFKEEMDKAQGWWLVLRFFSQLAASSHVVLVATLESGREETFLALDIERHLHMRRNIMDVDVRADDVATIAEQGFRQGGLQLERDVIEEIKRKWDEFERKTAADAHNASPLPLACLLFAGLYQRFEDMAGRSTDSEVNASASLAFPGDSSSLELSDIGEEEIAFEQVIQKLADEAWVEAGFDKNFVSAIENDPEYLDLVKFLSPCIGLDRDGHMRLLSVPDIGPDVSLRSLLGAFRSRRLLVPVSTNNNPGTELRVPRIRLAHQAVIDHWRPARQWFKNYREYLAVEDRFRLDAKYWSSRGQTIPVDSEDLIADAAEVLVVNRVHWTGISGTNLLDEDLILREQVLAVFGCSETPDAKVKDVTRASHVHIAAWYHQTELLEKFVTIAPECLASVSEQGSSVFYNAVWTEGPAVKRLIEMEAPLYPPGASAHAIGVPIQEHLNESYRLLIEEVSDVNQVNVSGGDRLIHAAAQSGNMVVMQDLVRRGADLLTIGEAERTALHYAAYSGSPVMFAFLLPHLSPEAVDCEGNTPICLAAAEGRTEVIKTFLNSPLDDGLVTRVLNQRNNFGRTPLMQAAGLKHPQTVRVLLGHCNPQDDAQRTADGRSVLHIAVQRIQGRDVSDDERWRARKIVQILLEEDKRLDPNLCDEEGRTAFDVGHAYEEARRVIRHDDRIPKDYDKLTPGMRADDLSSRKPAVVLGLLRTAPEALTDTHSGNETGLEVLVRTKNVRVLATALAEALIPDDLLLANVGSMLEMACMSSAQPLRKELMARWSDEFDEDALALLLNASIRDEDEETLSELLARDVQRVRGKQATGSSVFHEMARIGDLKRFERLAQLAKLPLPIDDWGRRPSDLASIDNRPRVLELQEQMFTEMIAGSFTQPVPTKFHEYAKAGDVRSFERQARGAQVILPRDAEGQRPSDVAPEEHKAEIAALEARYFEEAH